MQDWSRRDFVRSACMGSMALALFPGCVRNATTDEKKGMEPRFKISLAQWSLNKSLFAGTLQHLDFAKKAVESFDIHAIEYVNQFFKDKATDAAYLAEMNKRAGDLGVKQLLIMVDGEGSLADMVDDLRTEAVKNHYKWVDAAKTLGCHSVRVNLYGTSFDRASMHTTAVDGLSALAIYAQSHGINVLVENHGGYSSDGAWLTNVINEVDLPNCGTLPDFGNFCIERAGGVIGENACIEEYDRYRGVTEMMPLAKAVSAKSYEFDATGNETTIDYKKMLDIVKASSYSGYIGVEYEGLTLSEDEGILATKKLLESLIV